MVGNLRNMANDMGNELERQNAQVHIDSSIEYVQIFYVRWREST